MEGSAMPGESHGDEATGRSVPEEGRGADAERALALSLRLIYIPVVVLLLGSLGAFVYATFVFVDSVRHIVHHAYPVGHNIGLFFLDIDLFLIGATFLISAIGLFELFIKEINRQNTRSIPAWLEMRDLNQLKARIIAMIVLVLSVSFVEVVVDAPSGHQALELGSGIAVVIIALTLFVRLGSHGGEGD
jgi:uncharacterized membrane protein YqhA